MQRCGMPSAGRLVAWRGPTLSLCADLLRTHPLSNSLSQARAAAAVQRRGAGAGLSCPQRNVPLSHHLATGAQPGRWAGGQLSKPSGKLG